MNEENVAKQYDVNGSEFHQLWSNFLLFYFHFSSIQDSHLPLFELIWSPVTAGFHWRIPLLHRFPTNIE